VEEMRMLMITLTSILSLKPEEEEAFLGNPKYMGLRSKQPD